MRKRQPAAVPALPQGQAGKDASLLIVDLDGLGDHPTTAVEAVRGDAVAQVGFTRLRIDRQGRGTQGIVRTMHAALGRGLATLLDSH